LFLVIFIDSTGLGLVFPILNALYLNKVHSILPIADTLATRDMMYGLTTGVFMLCWFFGAAIISDLSDVIGRKKALYLCLIGSFVGYLLTAIAIACGSIALIFIGRIISGFLAGSQPVAQASILDVAPEGKTATYIGYVLLATSLGFVVGPLLGGVLSNSHYVSWFNFTVPMYFVAALSAINLLLLATIYKETFIITEKVKIRPARAVELFTDAFKSKTIRYLSLVVFIFILGWSNFYSFIAMFSLKKFHFSDSETSYLMATMGVGFSIGMAYLVDVFARHFLPKTTVIISLTATALLAYAFVLASNSFWLWPIALVISITCSIAYATIISIFSEKVDATKQGWVMGVTGAIMALGFTITELLFGYLSHFNFSIPIWTCAIGISIAAYLALRIKEPKRKEI
jgi:predicted MFS family arabinose efflux permease